MCCVAGECNRGVSNWFACVECRHRGWSEQHALQMIPDAEFVVYYADCDDGTQVSMKANGNMLTVFRSNIVFVIN